MTADAARPYETAAALTERARRATIRETIAEVMRVVDGGLVGHDWYPDVPDALMDRLRAVREELKELRAAASPAEAAPAKDSKMQPTQPALRQDKPSAEAATTGELDFSDICGLCHKTYGKHFGDYCDSTHGPRPRMFTPAAPSPAGDAAPSDVKRIRAAMEHLSRVSSHHVTEAQVILQDILDDARLAELRGSGDATATEAETLTRIASDLEQIVALFPGAGDGTRPRSITLDEDDGTLLWRASVDLRTIAARSRGRTP